MKKMVWSLGIVLILVFVFFVGNKKLTTVNEFLVFKYEKVKRLNVFENDKYSLKNKFKSGVFFENVNGEVGFFKTKNESQLMVYRFKKSSRVSIPNSNLVAGVNVGFFDFEHSTSLYWGNPMINVISKSDSIVLKKIVLQIDSEKELIHSSLESNYMFFKIKSERVVIGNSLLDNLIILEFEPHQVSELLFFENEQSIFMIASSDNSDLLEFAKTTLD